MRKKMMGRLFGALAACSVLCMPSVVRAEGTDAARIPVSCEGENMDGPFTVVLEGPEDMVRTLSVFTEGTSFFEVAPQEAGVTSYTVYQEKGEDKDAPYDGRRYHVDVHATYGSMEDSDLIYDVIVYEDGKEEKLSGCRFVNKKDKVVEDGKTPAGGGGISLPSGGTGGNSNTGNTDKGKQILDEGVPRALSTALTTVRKMWDDDGLPGVIFRCAVGLAGMGCVLGLYLWIGKKACRER